MTVPRWLLADIEHTLTATGYRHVVKTNTPCHLWLRWTTTPPRIHSKTILIRGLRLKNDVRFCFVVYSDNEQEEAGDTLEHTFIKEPWPGCETRYFYFHGTVGGKFSPSTTAIFTLHRVAPWGALIILEPWTVSVEPPDFTRLILEPWTTTVEPPDFDRIILEEWTS